MKTLLAVLAAAMALAGCVAVPVYEPGPAYGGYYYAPPAATFSFGYSNNHYRGPRHRGWR